VSIAQRVYVVSTRFQVLTLTSQIHRLGSKKLQEKLNTDVVPTWTVVHCTPHGELPNKMSDQMMEVTMWET
jgi:hypothetical protein